MVIPFDDSTAPAPDGRGGAASLRFSAVWGAAETPVADFRHAARALLALAGHPPGHRVSQDAQLVVTELVTNAYRHAPGPGGILLELSPGGSLLSITVRDGSPRPPVLREEDARRAGGHGLRLIGLLCERLDHRDVETGKEVVARLRLRQSAG
ncbi:ATP-binding protein [Streptomyces sp. bgisy126]|uniref:ATP-binding protein n=1 Tax=unclassified Streptomyces TaxID=2593676 RepID=UPI003EBFF9B9